MDNNIEPKEEIKKEEDKKGIKFNQNQIAGAVVIAGLLIAGAILLKGNSSGGGVKLKSGPAKFSQCLDSGKYNKAIAEQATAANEAGVHGTPKTFILKDGKVVDTIDGALPFPLVKEKIDKALNDEKISEMKDVKINPVSSEDRTLGNKNARVVLIEYADYQCPFCGKFFKEVVQPVTDTYVKEEKVLFVYRDFAFLGQESLKAAEATLCANEQGKFWEYHDYLFTHQDGENRGNFSDDYLKSFARELKLK